MNKILIFAALSTCAFTFSLSTVQAGQERDALLVKYNSVSANLVDNQFGLPIVLESSEKGRVLRGEVIGLINHNLNESRQSFLQVAQWCDLLILHLNTKACTYETAPSLILNLYSGKKEYRTPQQAEKISFTFKVVKNEQNYLSVRLFSKDGPYDVSNSLIQLEATELPPEQPSNTSGGRTLIRLVFSYQESRISNSITWLYFATLARGKVGFTILDNNNNPPKYIKGVQGAIERNTLRYYLAILTRLKFRDNPNDMTAQFSHWFDQTQHYPRQLYEIPKAQYMAAKKKELLNQRNEQAEL